MIGRAFECLSRKVDDPFRLAASPSGGSGAPPAPGVAVMSEGLLIWSLPVAIALHNLEEAIRLPRWSEERAGR